MTGASRLAGLLRAQLTHEFAAFCVVGGVAFLITDVGSNLLHFKAGLGPLTAPTLATAAGMAVAFTGNRYWSFRHRPRSGVGREGALFVIFNLIALLIQLASIGFTTYALGMQGALAYNVALVIGIGLATLFRFWSYHMWVWQARSAPAGSP
jgi:putative flippase GtrA